LSVVAFASVFSFYAAAQSKKVAPIKFVGQVVCSICWDEADRNTTLYGTRADFQCAEECAVNGVSQALAVKNFSGEFVLYLLEDGKFKPSGKNWLAFIAKNVEIGGTLCEADGKQFLTVDTLKVLPVEKKSTSKSKKN